MKIFRTRPGAALAIAAALSLTASPAMARGGWGHHRHNDRIDGGDIFAGLLVIGGIAAIASAASKNKEKREADYRYEDRRYEDGRYDDSRSPDRDTRPEAPYREPAPNYGNQQRDDRSYGYRSNNLDGVVDTCVGEVERGNRGVDSVDTVNREGEGGRVQGRAGGREFNCTVDRDGRVRGVTVDGAAVY